jgi:hypothetical protein
MALEIQVLACGMTTNVAGFNRLMGFQPSLLDKWISNCNISGISVTVLASHFSSVIGNFRPQGGLIYMYDTSKRLSMPLLDSYSP